MRTGERERKGDLTRCEKGEEKMVRIQNSERSEFQGTVVA